MKRLDLKIISHELINGDAKDGSYLEHHFRPRQPPTILEMTDILPGHFQSGSKLILGHTISFA